MKIYGVKMEDTEIERLIENELIERGINYKKQVALCNITIADFFLPDTNTVIYCDGDYWHNYPIGNKRDKEQVRVLENNNYNVFRFWERDIRKSPSDCLSLI